MKFKLAIASLLLTLPCWGEPQLWVVGQPFPGPVRWFPTRTLAPLDALLQAVGCRWQADEDGIHIRTGATEGAVAEPLKLRGRLDFEGRPIRLEQHLQQDRVFVDVDQFADGLQCPYRKADDGSRIDLQAPLLLGFGNASLQGDSETPDFPIALEGLELKPRDGLLFGHARIRNRGVAPFRQVLVRVAVYQKNGRLLTRFAELLTDVGSGQLAAVQFPQCLCRTSESPVARVEFEVR